jgi:hypothetical protein
VDDVEDKESKVGPSRGPAFPRDDSIVEAWELQVCTGDFHATSSDPPWYDGRDVSRLLCMPRPGDPDLWAVHVKVCMIFISHYTCLMPSRLGTSQVLYFKYAIAVFREQSHAVWRLPRSLCDLVFQVTFSWKAVSQL